MRLQNRKNEPDDADSPQFLNLRRLPRHATNPLIETQRVKLGVRKRAAIGQDVNDMGRTTTIVTEEIVDASKFVKVYEAGLKASYELSSAAMKVWQLVLEVTGRGSMNSDEITLHSSLLEKAPVKMSEDTYERGLRELVAKRFLAAHVVPYRYWVNPHFFIKGSTFNIVQRYQIAEQQLATKKPIATTTAALPPSLFDDEDGK